MGPQGPRGSKDRLRGGLKGQGVGLLGPRGSRDWPTGSQGVKGFTDRVPEGQGIEPRGS